VCKQESVWIEPFFTLTYTKTINLKYSQPPKPDEQRPPLKPIVFSYTKVLSLSTITSKQIELSELRMRLSQSKTFSPQDVVDVDDLWNVIAREADYIPLQSPEDDLVSEKDPKKRNVITVANTAAPEMLADYSRVYYFNARRPWIGSSQLDVELNPDGTLAKGSAQAQSQTLQAFLNFVPTAKDLAALATGVGATAVKGMAAAVQLLPPGTEIESVQLQLALKQDNFRHTHTARVAFRAPCVPAANGVVKDYELKIDAPNASAGSDDGSNTIDVSGKIKLPSASPSSGEKAPPSKLQ
jgi:hypothetical protein